MSYCRWKGCWWCHNIGCVWQSQWCH